MQYRTTVVVSRPVTQVGLASDKAVRNENGRSGRAWGRGLALTRHLSTREKELCRNFWVSTNLRKVVWWVWDRGEGHQSYVRGIHVPVQQHRRVTTFHETFLKALSEVLTAG